MSHYKSIKRIAAGHFTADGLGSAQGPKTKPKGRLCDVHRHWKISRFSRKCCKCGFEELRND